MFAKYKSVIYESLMVILGCAIFGAGLDAFVLPHKLVSTGISGGRLDFVLCNGLIRWFLEYDFEIFLYSGLLGSGWAPALLSNLVWHIDAVLDG